MLSIFVNLEKFFVEKTISLNTQEPTKAYIVNVFKTTNKERSDYSKESLTIVYARAKFEHKFELFQNLGDWILFAQTLFPSHLNGASTEYYTALAQSSYYKCYRLMNRKWIIFEELADNFPVIIDTLQISFVPDETNQESSQSLLIRI